MSPPEAVGSWPTEHWSSIRPENLNMHGVSSSMPDHKCEGDKYILQMKRIFFFSYEKQFRDKNFRCRTIVEKKSFDMNL